MVKMQIQGFHLTVTICSFPFMYVNTVCIDFYIYCSQDSPREAVKTEPWTSDILYSVTVAILLIVVYVRTLHPSIPGGDSGECLNGKKG